MESQMKKYVLAVLLVIVGWVVTAATPTSVLLASSPNTALAAPNAQVTNYVEPGFPVRVNPTGKGKANNLVIANIDADANLEIIASIQQGEFLGAWNADGTPVRGWPVPGIEGVLGRSAAGNLKPALPGSEIVTVYSSLSVSELHAHSGNGTMLPGFPVYFTSRINSAPIMANLTGDETDEILLGTQDGNLHIYTADGTPLSGWPVSTGQERIGTPVVVDVNNDGELDVVFTAAEPEPSVRAQLYAFEADGTPLTGFPALIPRRSVWHVIAFLVAGDVDGDEEVELIVAGASTSNDPIIHIYGNTGALERNITYEGVTTLDSTPPMLADMDGDNIPEILVQSYMGVNVWYGDGTRFPGWPPPNTIQHRNAIPAVADINGDNVPEVLALVNNNGCGSGAIKIYNRDGVELQEYYNAMRLPSYRLNDTDRAFIADIDRDGRNEVIIMDDETCSTYLDSVPELWVFDFGGEQHGPIQWGQIGNGPQQNSLYRPLPVSVDLAVTMTDHPDQFPAGGKTRYQVTVRNLGSQAATDVTLTDTLPSGATLDKVTPSQGNCTSATGSVSCNLGKIINGGKATVEIVIRNSTVGTMTNIVSVMAAENETNLFNNVIQEETTITEGTDVTVSITANGERFTTGDTVTYTLEVENQGPQTAHNAVLRDYLPLGLSYISVEAPSQGSYDSDQNVWTIGDLAPGASATLQVNALVDHVTWSRTLNYTANVSISEPTDGDPDNSTTKFPIRVESANVSLSLTSSNPVVEPTGIVAFTVTLSNIGSGSVAASDVLTSVTFPEEFRLTVSNAERGTFNTSTGLWLVDTIQPNESLKLFLAGEIHPELISKVVTVSADIIDSYPADPHLPNNHAEVPVTIDGVDLRIESVVSPSHVNEGETVTWTITARQSASASARNTIVHAPMPDGVTYVSSYVPEGAYDPVTGIWSVGNLGPNKARQMTLTGQVNPGAGGKTITSNVEISSPNQLDIDLTNNSASSQFSVTGTDLRVGHGVSNATPSEGSSVTFQVSIQNLGPTDTTGVVVRSLLPEGVTYQSHSVSQGTYDPITGDWIIGDVPVTSVHPIVLRLIAQVNSGTYGTIIENTAQLVASDLNDPVSTNNTALATLAVGGVDLSVLKYVNTHIQGEGTSPVYTVRVYNRRANTASDIVVEDILPDGLTFVSAVASSGEYNPDTGLWHIEAMPGSSEEVLTITTTVNPGTTGSTITNQARIISTAPFDPFPDNSVAQEAFIVGMVYLSLTNTVDDNTPDPNQIVNYTVTVTNASPYAATGLEVLDLLPPGLNFVSASPSIGTYDPDTGIWAIGSVDGEQSATLTISAQVQSNYYGQQITNTAAITEMDNPDHYTGDNQQSVSLMVNSVDLQVTANSSVPVVRIGDSYNYSVTVTNVGTINATGVVLSNTLPDGVSLTSTNTSQGNGCVQNDSDVICNLGNIAIGQSATVTLSVTGNPDIHGPMTLVATVTSDQPEFNTTNNNVSKLVGITNLIVTAADDVDDGACGGSHCSLREAMLAANNLPGPDTIRFHIAGSGVHSIRPTTALPVMNEPIIIDGSTQPGYTDTPLIELDGRFISGGYVDGISLAGGSSTVRGLSIKGFSNHGIYISGSNNVIVGNHIGADLDNYTSRNVRHGILIGYNADNNVIGGAAPELRNVISGNGHWGIYALSSNNIIQGNYIGVDASGRVWNQNRFGGVLVDGSNNLIGGLTPAERNIISGNGGDYIHSLEANVTLMGSSNIVQGNYIGLDVTGTQKIWGGSQLRANGVYTEGANHLIGGTEPGAGNVISGVDTAIYMGTKTGTGSSQNGSNTVQGNLLGTDVTGLIPIINNKGIVVASNNNQIGGTNPAARNVIANNRNNGFEIRGAHNSVQGNFIGTDINGTVAMPNNIGILVTGSFNQIGGTTPEARNIIASSVSSGIYLQGATGNIIEGNYIGTDVSGSLPRANGSHGIRINPDPPSSVHRIGGETSGAGNRITYNGTGIYLEGYSSPLTAAILSNEIYANTNLGIEIRDGNTGIPYNDPGDADNGPNNLQNYPDLTGATLVDSTLTISGTLDSVPNTAFRIEFFSNRECDPSGYGEGETLIGAATVNVGSSGPATFDIEFENPALVGQYITATASDPDNNTSKFSNCVLLAGADLQLALDVDNHAPNVGEQITYTLTLVNDGPDTATDVLVEALLPTGLTYQSDSGSGTYTSQTGIWSLSDLAVGSSANLTITALVEPSVNGSVVTYTATATSDQSDFNPDDNTASADILVSVAELDVITETDNPAPNVGDTIQYITVITNEGPSTATNVAVSSPLPTGVTFVSELLSQGTYDETTGQWLVGTLPQGGQAALTVTVTVNPEVAGTTIDNTVTITATDQYDSSVANNTDSGSIQVGIADIEIESLVDETTVSRGDPVQINIVMTNHGPSHATSISVENALPEGIIIDTATVTDGTYDSAAGSWSLDNLPTGNQAILTLTGTIEAGTDEQVLSGSVSATNPEQLDPNLANNTANVDITVEAEADLAVSNTVQTEIAGTTQMATYTISITNNGSVSTTGVTTRSVLPADMEFISASISRGVYDYFTGLWSIGNLDNLEVVTLTLHARVRPGTFVPSITTTAGIVGTSVKDSNTENNSASSSFDVVIMLSPPSLVSPLNGAVTETPPTLTWNPIPGAAYYQLQFGTTNPPDILIDNLEVTSYTTTNTLAASYYWRVRAVSVTGTTSDWSEVWHFEIATPQNAAPMRNLYTTNQPTLAWGEVSWAMGYMVEIADNPNFTAPYRYEVGRDTFTLTTDPLADGLYYWRVRARKPDGSWGNWSGSDNFMVADS